MKLVKSLSLITVIYLFISPVYAKDIQVAVAANFTAPMKQIAQQFEKTSGYKVSLAFGSSGKFFAQIQNGAPYEIFLSADQAKPIAMEKAGLMVPGSRFTYAIGTLALWSPKAGVVKDGGEPLQSGQFNKLSLANPKLAPYGLAATQTLEKMHLTAATRAKWVQGENISQTYQFVASGNADIGFVALSQIMSNGKISSGSSWLVPSEYYSPIRQDAVLLKAGADDAGAKALLSYLQSDAARAIIHAYGYKTE